MAHKRLIGRQILKRGVKVGQQSDEQAADYVSVGFANDRMTRRPPMSLQPFALPLSPTYG
jgi:hypothetical protein